jgi:hypothetical protein
VSIVNRGTLTLTNSMVSDNTADGGDGIIVNSRGGIVNSGTLTLTNSTVSGNTADSTGGGIYNTGTLTLTNSTVSQNEGHAGGGIYNYGGTLTLTNSTVSGNSAGLKRTQYYGGGIYNDGVLTLTNTTVSENTAGGGGGIDNRGSGTLTNSTVSGNTADSTGGGIGNSDTLTLTNSTVSGNTADSTGGGIGNSGTLTLTNSTVSGNSAGIGRAIYNSYSGTATLRSTLVDGDCTAQFGAPNISNGYNIESPANTCGLTGTGDQNTVDRDDLNLGPLRDNGGPTWTHALRTDPVVSAAINQIPEAACEVDTDQRGEPRPETGGTMCDVGAFEVQP